MMEALKRLPRGLRNCNPGNIRKSAQHFAGEVEGHDLEFKTFRDMAAGFRAMFKILHTYVVLYRLRTIRDIISRWAPAEENCTDDYVFTVCTLMNMREDEPLHWDRLLMTRLATAIATVECGAPPSSSDVLAGWHYANRPQRSRT